MRKLASASGRIRRLLFNDSSLAVFYDLFQMMQSPIENRPEAFNGCLSGELVEVSGRINPDACSLAIPRLDVIGWLAGFGEAVGD